MSILKDTTWPARIIRCIDRAHNKATRDQNRYNGAYNTLLTYCFPVQEWSYVVTPDLVGDNSRGPINFVVLYVFDMQDRPVMIVQVQDDLWLKQADTRLRADDQIRDRFEALLAQCPIPVLYGISILGTKMHIYRGFVATGEVAPAELPRSSTPPADFLADQWGVDIRSQDAFDKVQQIVKDIANEVAKL